LRGVAHLFWVQPKGVKEEYTTATLSKRVGRFCRNINWKYGETIEEFREIWTHFTERIGYCIIELQSFIEDKQRE